MYTVESSTEVAITALSHTTISERLITAALDIEISAGITYSSYLLTEVTEVISLTSLFTVTFEQRLTVQSYSLFAADLMLIWGDNTGKVSLKLISNHH